MGDKVDIRSIRGWGKRETGWLSAWVDSTWKGGGRLHREDAGERKRERASFKGQ